MIPRTHEKPLADALGASVMSQLQLDGSLVNGMSADYCEPQLFSAHQHPEGQLVYAATGVIVVGSEQGYWVAPPTRALWLSPGARHWTRTIGNVQLRSVFLQQSIQTPLPNECCVVNVSPLMREVITALAARPVAAAMSPRDAALTTLLLHELDGIPVLPLHLPALRDTRLLEIQAHILGRPQKSISLAAWGRKLGLDQRTLHRLFVRETGMSYQRWLQQAQLLLALEWLADGRRVIDVAVGLGYSSQSAFTVMFKRNLGVPPAAFFSNSVARTLA
jgi:AraC-like DNA-binding protein